ncbi:MAG: single-stranded-DNA-specific exonuclease RecJ [Bacteroidetes bacterium 24-39-8]|jgi:single-stranded-DNA-specific exonuclease|nr:MAG: single-stranded-DNA-specific exonuclease RecJ [Sphingobacteriia bacterium 35-40-8]OYZ48110.1 MAG: single-stranded-DNA-specific exonuclease RecJ [Bacteroidetes bacterium 24-39-8]OZA64782.1 MAG: single-stranded-DNA-specific exonuclease RecJ [Sphingobacteriia bacterium 39-39-8]HQR91945.1 single-stranded-DNA-specific exonuclease RecJ [Sediminibacterium sp.]HQS55941.1 single-stranded-DNA-specific exonuclease RecJ [Sediminibacterium sp.]
MQKRWNILDSNKEKVEALQSSLKINKTICRILVQRGLEDFEASKHFFRPQLSDLHSPWLMKDMDKAVERILLAFDQSEKVLVFGDYDVDGTTAVACLYQFLLGIYGQVDYYIPHRYREGYGVSKAGIDFAHEQGMTLIISLDCGIKSIDLIAYAKTLGIDFIVCDHHLPDKELPPAVAILNAKQPNCTYPYKELCGCGVGFKLASALAERLGLPSETYLKYLDLVATAIAADIVPMTGENRVLTFYGLQKINEDPCPGIKALKDLAGVKNKMLITNVVFMIAPRVNAAGRMDDAKKAVQVFIEQDSKKAVEYASLLHSDNSDRKEMDASITKEALELIGQDTHFSKKKTTVVYQEHWHKGVVGIVASRLIEKHYRPTIVLTKSGDYAGGSARSVAGFNLYEAIHACREWLIGYGGHFAAAGMTLLPENVNAFAEAFEAEVSRTIPDALLIPEIIIDAPVEFSEITPSFYQILQQMEPYGPENMRPVFVARNVMETGFSKILQEAHIKFVLKQKNINFSGIGFNMADKFHLLQMQEPLDLVFCVEENEWNNTTSLQLRVIDIMLSKTAPLP